MTKIHLPISNKGRKIIIPTDLPVIFLAGPIRNAPKWQDALIKQLYPKGKNIFIASPTRELSEKLMILVEKDGDGYQLLERQRAWEQYYMNQASESGCIIFWLPKESEKKESTNKVYAHITMMELGLWIARKKINPNINIVIGTDGSFPEWRTIKFELDIEIPSVPISYSLEETIENALKLIGNSAVKKEYTCYEETQGKNVRCEGWCKNKNYCSKKMVCKKFEPGDMNRSVCKNCEHAEPIH